MKGVARLGLGLAALGRPGYINLGHARDLGGEYAVATMRSHAHAVLDAAYAAGIRYFDAARSYGRAEEFLAAWLEERSPADVTIGSKWGYTYTAGWSTSAEHHEIKDHSLDALRRQWGESRAVLHDRLDLYQIHSVVPETGVLENEEVLAELARMRADGVRIGLSVSGPRQSDSIRRALEVEADGRPLFAAVQATFNLLEQTAAPALGEAHEAGLQVIIKEGVANGRLTDRNDLPEDARSLAAVQAGARRHDATVDAFALGFVLSRPWVDLVLSGAATVEQLHSNVRSEELAREAADEDLAATARQDSESYWRIRSALPWG